MNHQRSKHYTIDKSYDLKEEYSFNRYLIQIEFRVAGLPEEYRWNWLEDEELQSDAAVNHGPENRSFLSDFNDELSSLAFFRRLQNLQVWFIQEPEILHNMVSLFSLSCPS